MSSTTQASNPLVLPENQSPILYCASTIVLGNSIPWDFANRLWQVEIMNLWHPDVVIKKPTQVGITTTCVVRGIHFADVYDGRVIFSFPRQKDVTDYVQTVMKPIIDNSPILQTRRKGIWQVYNHSIGNGFLSFMECSVEPRAIPTDWVINDEVDKSDQDNLEKFRNRTDASRWKIHWKMSTPTIPGFGIDMAFQNSDQNEWIVTCPHCNHKQFLTWEKNIKTRDETFVYYGCSKCDKQLPNEAIINGSWEPMSPGKGKARGYHITQMMLPLLHTAPSLMRASNRALSQKTFFNLNLGEAQHSAAGGFTPELFNAYTFSGDYDTEIPLPNKRYYMGVDQGDKLDVAIFEWTGVVFRPVFKKVIVSIEGKAFDELEKIQAEWNPILTVVDRHPNAQSAVAFRGGRRNVILSYYSDIIQTIYDKPDENGVFAIHKVEALDAFRRWIIDGKIQLPGNPGSPSSMANDIIESFCTLKRDEEERTVSGVRRLVAVYRKAPGRDDLANACLYAFVAFLSTGHEKLRITTTESNRDKAVPRPPTNEDDLRKADYFYSSHPFTLDDLKTIIDLINQGNSIMEVAANAGRIFTPDKIIFLIGSRRKVDLSLFLYLCNYALEKNIIPNKTGAVKTSGRRPLLGYATNKEDDPKDSSGRNWSVESAFAGNPKRFRFGSGKWSGNKS